MLHSTTLSGKLTIETRPHCPAVNSCINDGNCGKCPIGARWAKRVVSVDGIGGNDDILVSLHFSTFSVGGNVGKIVKPLEPHSNTSNVLGKLGIVASGHSVKERLNRLAGHDGNDNEETFVAPKYKYFNVLGKLLGSAEIGFTETLKVCNEGGKVGGNEVIELSVHVKLTKPAGNKGSVVKLSPFRYKSYNEAGNGGTVPISEFPIFK